MNQDLLSIIHNHTFCRKKYRNQHIETKGLTIQGVEGRHKDGWHSLVIDGFDLARSMWLEKSPKAGSAGQEIKEPGDTDVVFIFISNLGFRLQERIQNVKRKLQ